MAAIQTRLLEDSTVASFVGARVYDSGPDNPTYPYIIMGDSISEPWEATCVEGQEQFPTLSIYSTKRGRTQAGKISAAVKTALHNADFTVAGHDLVMCRVSSSRTLRDAETTHVAIRLRVITQKNGD